MRVLATGALGMVGTTLKKVLTNHSLIITDKENLDVTDYREVVSYLDKGIDFIVHLAAETDLEFCEKNVNKAYTTNAIGCKNMVLLAEELDIPLLYISTAGVFDGTKNRPYSTQDQPNPINIYGRSKWYGENYVSQYRKSYTVRASWMIGGGPDIDKKFVNKIITKIKKGDKEIKVCNDVYGSPTYTVDLVKNIQRFIEGEFEYGLYHCAGMGSATRYDVAKAIVEILGKEHTTKIIPSTSQEVSSEFPCARSKNEVLINSNGIEMTDWRFALKDYLDDYYRY